MTSRETNRETSLVITFDTETTGLPLPKLPYGKYHKWWETRHYDSARLLELSWSVRQSDGSPVREKSYLVKPAGWSVAATEIHGITQDAADRNGIPVDRVLLEFMKDLHTCEYRVAHNAPFDVNVIASELYRLKKYDIAKHFATLTFQCTMVGGKVRYGKNLKLAVLHENLFKEKFAGAHRAAADVAACERCYFMLSRDIDTKTIASRTSDQQGAGIAGEEKKTDKAEEGKAEAT